MNKWLSIILLLLTLVAVYAENEKSYKANNYAVDMYLLTDGTVRIAEEVVFQFTGGPFHYVNRDVPPSKVDWLLFENAAMDSIPISDSSVPNYYSLNMNNGLHLKWYYSPLQDETHSFFFQYKANGIYTIENGLIHLLWKPLPTEFSYYMDKASVRVHLPKELPLSKISFGSKTDMMPSTYGDSLLVYQYTNLNPNTVVRIDLLFPENLISVPKPQWPSKIQSSGKSPMIVFSFVMVFILMIVFWAIIGTRMNSKYSRFKGEEIIYEDLPSSIEPALLGRMINGGYSIPTSIYATLVNLAQRGVIKIQSLPKTKWYEAGGNMSFEYLENQVELTSPEQAIIEMIYGKPPQPGSVKLLDLQKRIMKNAKYIRNAIEDSLIQCGYLDPFQMEKKKKLLAIGLTLSFLDFALLFGALAYFKDVNIAAVISFVAVFFIGTSILMGGSIIRVFTDSGMMELASWNSFAKYLRKWMKEPNTSTADDFNRIFPYALVMNLGNEWVSYFKKAGIDVGAVWLESDASSSDSWAPLITISTMSSPSSSSSGGGGGSSGGGGGGGGSGAG